MNQLLSWATKEVKHAIICAETKDLEQETLSQRVEISSIVCASPT